MFITSLYIVSAWCVSFDWPLKCLIKVWTYFLHGHGNNRDEIELNCRVAMQKQIIHELLYNWNITSQTKIFALYRFFFFQPVFCNTGGFCLSCFWWLIIFTNENSTTSLFSLKRVWKTNKYGNFSNWKRCGEIKLYFYFPHLKACEGQANVHRCHRGCVENRKSWGAFWCFEVSFGSQLKKNCKNINLSFRQSRSTTKN